MESETGSEIGPMTIDQRLIVSDRIKNSQIDLITGFNILVTRSITDLSSLLQKNYFIYIYIVFTDTNQPDSGQQVYFFKTSIKTSKQSIKTLFIIVSNYLDNYLSIIHQ